MHGRRKSRADVVQVGARGARNSYNGDGTWWHGQFGRRRK